MSGLYIDNPDYKSEQMNINLQTQYFYSSPNSRVGFGTTMANSMGVNPETNTELNPQTMLFRDDVNWNFLVKTIKNKFSNGASIYCYAGSDGSEAYSLAMKLVDKYGDKEAEKFLPIKSIDRKQKVVDIAKAGLIGIDEASTYPDTYAFYENIKKKRFEDYFTKDDSLRIVKSGKPYDPPFIRYYKVSKPLQEKVEFRQGNILKDTTKEFKEPCVLMFRNAWYHLEDNEIKQLTENLSSNLKKGSLVVIGGIENSRDDASLKFNIDSLLQRKNFVPVKKLFGSAYIFEKQ